MPRSVILVALAVGGAAALGSGVLVYTQSPREAVFEYQSSMSFEGRILDVTVFRDSIFVLTGDSGGTQIHTLDPRTNLKTGVIDAKNSFAMAPDPSTGLIYLLAATRQRGPFHYIYALDPASKETELVSTLDEQYAHRGRFPGFVATGAGELVINNRVTGGRPELVVVNQDTGFVDRYIDLPPSLSEPAEPRLVPGEYLYRLRRLSKNQISALGINNGNLYIINVPDSKIVHEESVGVPDFPPTLDPTNGMVNTAPVVFDVYHFDGFRLDLGNGFPEAQGSEIMNLDGSRSPFRLDGPEMAIAGVSYSALERVSPTEWLGVDTFRRNRIDRLTIK